MATFTRTLWETGDTITADGLNGGKGYSGTLLLTAEDDDDGSFIIDVSADLTLFDIMNMFVTYPDESDTITEGVKLATDVGGYYKIELHSGFTLFYDPVAKKLQNSAPLDDN